MAYTDIIAPREPIPPAAPKLDISPQMVFIGGMSENPFDDAKSGDAAYMLALQKYMRDLEPPMVVALIGGCDSDENMLYQQMKSNIALNEIKEPTFHLMLNFQTKTGLVHTVDGLKKFKAETGAKIVLTNIEFRLYDEKKFADEHYAEKATAYFHLADEFVFLDQPDKKRAIEAYEQYGTADANYKETLAKLQSAKTIPVPAVIDLAIPDHKRDGKDVCVLGMIRPDKGYEHVIELAGLMKAEGQGRKIVMAGMAKQKIDPNLVIGDTELAKILKAIYPDAKADIDGCGDYGNLLKLVETLPETHALALPIELHLNKRDEEIAPLFKDCCVAFSPDAHGMTLHNSAKNSFMVAGMPVAAYESGITPDMLKQGGDYEGAMIRLEKDNGVSLAQQMMGILQDRTIMEKAHRKCAELVQDQLSSNAIATAHAKVYAQCQREQIVGQVYH